MFKNIALQRQNCRKRCETAPNSYAIVKYMLCEQHTNFYKSKNLSPSKHTYTVCITHMIQKTAIFRNFVRRSNEDFRQWIPNRRKIKTPLEQWRWNFVKKTVSSITLQKRHQRVSALVAEANSNTAINFWTKFEAHICTDTCTHCNNNNVRTCPQPEILKENCK